MLSITPIKTAGGVGCYYEQESGQTEYWAKEAGDSSRWQGGGAHALGLEGAVDQQVFEKLMGGQLPDGTQLKSGAGGERRAGYDLTFSAPKSVSIAGLVFQDERVLMAHDRAVSSALKYLEEETTQTRIKESGMIYTEQTGNFVAATFRHQTSRNLDPQMHTHAVLANVTQSADGQWRALSTEELYRHKMAGGAVYRAELAAQLKELGYELRPSKDGFELVEVSDQQIEAFSSRRAEIERYLVKNGMSGARASEIAALGTRDRKIQLDVEQRAQLSGSWQQRATELGLSPETIKGKSVGISADASESVTFAVRHLAERQSVFQRQHIIRHALNHGAAAGLTLKHVQTEIDLHIADGDLLQNGRNISTRQTLQRELQTVQAVKAGKGSTESITSRELDLEGLTTGQTDAVKLSLTSTDRFIGIEGKAGTGKTTMLRRVVEEAQAEGYEVVAAAPTAKAAGELERETGAAAVTVTKHLMSASSSAPKQLWIIDEAGMLSTRQAQQLVQRAERANAKVIFTGDRQQLQAVEAGKPFAVMMDRGMASSRMDQIMRQRNQHLKQAVEKIIEHKGSHAIRAIDSSITSIPNRDERLKAIADRYLSAPAASRARTGVIVQTNRDRNQLNGLIRDGLRAEGVLQGERVKTTTLVKTGWTRAQAEQLHNYSEGMTIRFTRNYKGLGVQKGESLDVAGIDHKKGVLLLNRLDGAQVQWSPKTARKAEAFQKVEADIQKGDQIRFTRNEYDLGRTNGMTAEVLAISSKERTAQVRTASGHELQIKLDESQHQTWTHGHAMTVHAAQGATFDRAILGFDTEQGMSNEQSIYVGLSRARDGVDLHTNDRDALERAADKDATQSAAIEVFDQQKQNQEMDMGVER